MGPSTVKYGDVTLSGRELARLRRQAMATAGKTASRASAQSLLAQVQSGNRMGLGGVVLAAAHVSPSPQIEQPRGDAASECACTGAAGGCGCNNAASAEVVSATPAPQRNPYAAPTGRTLARARRQALAAVGKPGIQRVANATRIAASMPDRADWQTALEQGATGRQLAMQKRLVASLTGRTEANSHAAAVRPSGRTRPALQKVEAGHTLSGQEVTGTQVERSGKVTGQEPGTCRNVTGTEYIGQEQFEAWCEARPQPRPPKVGQSLTAVQQQTVSGTAVDPKPLVTGNQTGACRGITGTQYLAAETLQLCQDEGLRGGPHKVSVMSSRGQQTVTGVTLHSGGSVTGGEAGAQRPITGTQYARSSSAKTQVQPASWRPQSLTGDRPGVGGGGVTGDERGACEPVTGTAYIGPDNQHASCRIDGVWLTRHPELALEQVPAAPQGFSIVPPARQRAPERERSVTGVASGSGGASERITGPGFKAQGMITGTPEFRHGSSPRATGRLLASERTPAAPTAPAAPATPPATASSQISGDGRQQGSRVTGDAWSGNSRVSGTEGAWSQGRNPTLRGQPRGVGMDARAAREQVREQVRPEIPPSPVTGSSGNTGRGATVTVSGGARG
ncbi:MAG: hypothetical protein C0441_04720 [Comamonadaceae bacterium]|nr:hypothetical protein [Comamonadaceae bacterium]